MINMFIKNNNTVVVVNPQHHLIMQHSSSVDAFRVLVDKVYTLDLDGKEVAMDDFKCVMEYLLPNSKKYRVIELEKIEDEVQSNSGTEPEMLDDKYANYLKFRLPINSEFTKEPGDIEIQFTFAKKGATEEDENIIRKTDKAKITIEPTTEWSNIGIDVFNKELEEILKEETPSI